jgi:hypothetical protein
MARLQQEVTILSLRKNSSSGFYSTFEPAGAGVLVEKKKCA